MTALGHLRVLDLSQGVAGAFCTKLFAGFGAEVVKIEPPDTGDAMRHVGPFASGEAGLERCLPFLWLNTAKKSVTLDVASAGGAARCRLLAAKADIVVESFAPGRAARMGIGYERVRELNPEVVFVSISSFGQSGPYRDYPTEEITSYAMSGGMIATGDARREPLAAGPSIIQASAGMKAYVAGLMGYLRRVRTGEGVWIDLSIQEVGIDNVEIAMAEYLHLGRIAKRSNDEHALVPWRTYRCRDGHAAILGGPVRHWLKAAEMFEEPELTGNKYDHMAKRIAHRDTIKTLMEPWLMAHDKKCIYHEGQRRGLAFSYLASLRDVLESPQLEARHFFVEHEHPVLGSFRLAGAPFLPSASPWRSARAPLLGEHTDEVLSEWLEAEPSAVEALDGGGRRMTGSAKDQPLAGIRVIDMTHDWAGPHATRILGDYGAEVVKIEYPPRLCGMRGAYLEKIDRHPRWWEINRNKAAITLDLHLPKHLQAFKELAKAADVVIDNSRPGVMERFGVGYEELRRLKSDIILVSMSAYGATGPESSYAGYGGAIEAISGVQSLTAYEKGSDAMRVREVDVTNGIMGACAVMTALVHRQHSGRGQLVDLAQREASTWLIGEHLLELEVNGEQTLPLGNRHRTHAPQGCYRCAGDDRWIVLTVRNDEEWRSLCRVIGAPACAEDSRFVSAPGRRLHHVEIDRMIGAWTEARDVREAFTALRSQGLCAGPVVSVADLADDPHLAARQWFVSAPDGEGARYPGFPFSFVGSIGGRLRARGGDLGADNGRILGGALGWSEAELPDLGADALGTSFDLE